MIRSVVQTKENYLGVKSVLYGKCCSSFWSISSIFLTLMGPLYGGALPFRKMTPLGSKPGQLLRIASRNQSDNNAQ